eukprot:356627-Chlamydomonas_euryale.AAC.4
MDVHYNRLLGSFETPTERLHLQACPICTSRPVGLHVVWTSRDRWPTCAVNMLRGLSFGYSCCARTGKPVARACWHVPST